MMKEAFLVLAIGLTLVLVGCIQENSTGPDGSNNSNTAGTTLENGNNATDAIGDKDIPFIEKNDTVEIGQMI